MHYTQSEHILIESKERIQRLPRILTTGIGHLIDLVNFNPWIHHLSLLHSKCWHYSFNFSHMIEWEQDRYNSIHYKFLPTLNFGSNISFFFVLMLIQYPLTLIIQHNGPNILVIFYHIIVFYSFRTIISSWNFLRSYLSICQWSVFLIGV